MKHLRDPYMTETSEWLEDKWYQARSEPHCDDHVGGVLKWHKGVTLYEPLDGQGQDLGTRTVDPSETEQPPPASDNPSPRPSPTPKPVPVTEPDAPVRPSTSSGPNLMLAVCGIGLLLGIAYYASSTSPVRRHSIA